MAHRAAVMEQDRLDRDTGLHTPPVQGRVDWAASLLVGRRVNTSERLSGLPRRTKEAASRYRSLPRWLKNPWLDRLAALGGFIPEMALLAGCRGKPLVLLLEQSKISDGFACLLGALRGGERAIPVAWKGKQSKGGIGLAEQTPWRKAVFALRCPPEPLFCWGATAASARPPCSAGVRSTAGTSVCAGARTGSGVTRAGRSRPARRCRRASGRCATPEWNHRGVTTHLGILPEEGHPESCIRAWSAPPTPGPVLDDGRRGGMEPMFSDCQWRAFAMTPTQLRPADRLARRILVLPVALYWAASTGLAWAEQAPQAAPKKRTAASCPS